MVDLAADKGVAPAVGAVRPLTVKKARLRCAVGMAYATALRRRITARLTVAETEISILRAACSV